MFRPFFSRLPGFRARLFFGTLRARTEQGDPGMTSENETLALRAGAARAWRDHRSEVEEAIAGAQRLAAAFTRPSDPAAEPIPAYASPATAPATKAPARKGTRR